ncbi:MAG TPA: hypothetical protein VGI16_16155 [Candidatus Acidoferrum sp.]|jgi:hypothetical protein
MCLAVCLILTCAFPVQEVAAYESPLNPASVHEAFVLGQRNDKATADFLSPYSKEITGEGLQGPHIAQIDILTPFTQIVDASRQNTSGYTEQEAEAAFRQHGNTVIVRVVLMLPAAFPKKDDNAAPQNPAPGNNAALRPENFWQNFQFNVKQKGKTLASRSIHNKPIFSSATKDTPSVLDGETVWLEFDAKDVASDQITVDVVTPEAKTISATFDLRKLR